MYITVDIVHDKDDDRRYNGFAFSRYRYLLFFYRCLANLCTVHQFTTTASVVGSHYRANVPESIYFALEFTLIILLYGMGGEADTHFNVTCHKEST